MLSRVVLAFRILAGVFTAVAVVLALLAWLYWRDLHRCSASRPVNMTVDLSEPGEFECGVDIKYPYGYGFDLRLLFPESSAAALAQENALAGLNMDFTIYDPDGIRELVSSSLEGERCNVAKGKSGYSVTVMRIRRRLRRGHYTLRLRIDEGLPEISDAEPRLVMAYMINFDMMGPMTLATWSVFSLFGAAFFALLGFENKREKNNNDGENAG